MYMYVVGCVLVFPIVYHKGCLVNMPFHCRESASCAWKLKRHQIIGMDYHVSNKTTTRIIHETLCMLNYVYIENLSAVCKHTP